MLILHILWHPLCIWIQLKEPTAKYEYITQNPFLKSHTSRLQEKITKGSSSCHIPKSLITLSKFEFQVAILLALKLTPNARFIMKDDFHMIRQ